MYEQGNHKDTTRDDVAGFGGMLGGVVGSAVPQTLVSLRRPGEEIPMRQVTPLGSKPSMSGGLG